MFPLLTIAPILGADRVQFHYRFPARFSAVVSTTRLMATDTDESIVTQSIRTVYALSVTPSGDSYRQMRYRSLGQSVENGADPLSIPFYRALIDISDRYFQSVLIGPSANLEFQNFDQSIQRATQAAYRLAKTPETRRLVDDVFDPEGVQYAEKDQWMRMVQMWDGVSALVGTWYQARGAEYIPQLGRIVPCDFFFRVRSRVPCGISTDCVLIEAKSVPDSAAIMKAVYDSSTNQNPILPPRFVTVFSIVTDAKTLRPILYTETRESTIGAQFAVSTVRTAFTYRTR